MSKIQKFLIVLALMALASCGGRSGKDAPVLKLEVEPLPGIHVQYDSRTSAFRIGNELIERRISINNERRLISTIAFTNKLSGRNYIRGLGEEFSFEANNVKLSGVTGDFEYVDHEIFGSGGVKSLVITLQAKRREIGILRVKLVYEIYSQMPVIRKWIEIRNPGGSSVTIDSIQVESLRLLPGAEYDLEVYTSSTEDWAALSPIILDTRLMEGFLTGNEAPGALKYSDLYSDGKLVSIGMKPSSEIQLAPNEEFISPAVFFLFFKGEPDPAKETLAKFAAEYLTRSKTEPHSVWYENIVRDMTEAEARQKVQLAQESGADIFCLDGFWMDRRGDWMINEDANVEAFRDYARESGMKFGLSIDLAVADPASLVIVEYPQWAVKLANGSDYTISDGGAAKVMCLGSEYTLYIAREIEALVKELDLDYVRLAGPMIPDGEASGCFAQDHVHRSSAESLWYIYEGFFAICNHLHSQHPDLIVDVSARSYNPEGTIDYALLKYADVEWPL